MFIAPSREVTALESQGLASAAASRDQTCYFCLAGHLLLQRIGAIGASDASKFKDTRPR